MATVTRTSYLNDVRKQAAMVAAHGAKLKSAAPERIAKAGKLIQKSRAASDESELDQHAHAVSRLLHEVAFYPPHDVRRETPEYKKAHAHMVRDLDLPCLACGVRNSTLKDPEKNPFGAVQMETHHHIVEWAMANAIDPVKFNSHVLPGLLRKNPQKYGQYKDGMTKDQILAWVDHDEDNLWVLCDVHHRHTFVGIHAVTFPIWGPQDILDDEIIGDYLAQSKQKTAPKKAAKKTAKKTVKKAKPH
jgi:hypothetical protein